MKEPETYRCLTCGLEIRDRKRSDNRDFSCASCGGLAFLVGPLEPPSVEVHLRRMRVDEAMMKLDRYLNTAFLAGLPRVRIIHGKGTGTVRRAVVEALTDNQLVDSHRPALLEEGGSGVTVVEMALH